MKMRLFAVSGVMLLAFCLLLVFPDASMSASVLSEEEMGAIQGGCVRCKAWICGVTDSPCESGAGGTCDPGNPSELCDNIKIETERVINCGTSISGTLCSRGALTTCGKRYQCWCEDGYQCRSYILGFYEYWSGCAQS